MNMTSQGIGWGVTQYIEPYGGDTIRNIPIGCTVAVETDFQDAPASVYVANFSGTFASLSAQVDCRQIVGNSLYLTKIDERVDPVPQPGGGMTTRTLEKYGGVFIRLS